MGHQFTLEKEDWSLHRKGQQDQERHQQKVRKAIKENMGDLVSDESVIMSDGRQILKIPVRSLEEYRFRYNFSKSPHGGEGDGDTRVGDVIAQEGKGSLGQGPGKGQGAGDSPGVDYTEAEVTLEEIADLLFEELELPNLVQKAPDKVTITDYDYRDVRKHGLMNNIDKKRTLLEAIRRNQTQVAHRPSTSDSKTSMPSTSGQITTESGESAMDVQTTQTDPDQRWVKILPDDLRFKTWENIEKPDSAAVVLAMMDTSGSMGLFEKYCARTFFFWMTRFLRTKYEMVQIRYIAHHTEAKEVSEEHFFTKGESGGTICSSAYEVALNMIDKEYSPDYYNIYPIHFSDGDNLTSDNEKCVKLVKELCDRSQMFGYSEVNQYNRSSTLMSAYGKLSHPVFQKYVIRDKSNVYDALKFFFSAKAPEVKRA